MNGCQATTEIIGKKLQLHFSCKMCGSWRILFLLYVVVFIIKTVNIRLTDGGVTTRSDSDSDPENPETKETENPGGKLGAVPSDLGSSSSMGSTTSTGSEESSRDIGKRGKPGVGKSVRTNRKSKEWWERGSNSSPSSDSSSLDLPTREALAASKEEKPSSPKSEAEKPLLSKESPDRTSNAETSSTEPAKKRPGKSMRTRNSKEHWDNASIPSLSSEPSSFSSFSSEPSSFSSFSSEPSSPKEKEKLSAEAKCKLECLNKDGWVKGGEAFDYAQIPIMDGYLVEEDGVPTCKCQLNSQFMFFLNEKGLDPANYKRLENEDPGSARSWLEKNHNIKVNMLHTKRQMSRSPPVKRTDLPSAIQKELEEEESKNKPPSPSKNKPQTPSKNEPESSYRSPDNCTDKCQMDFAFIKLNETELKTNDIPYPGLYITVPVNASAPIPDCTCKINPRLLNYLRVKGHNETEFVEAHGLHNEHPWNGRVWLGRAPRGFRILFHDAPERDKASATPEKETVTASATPEKGPATASAKPEKGPVTASAKPETETATTSTTPGKKGT